MDALKDFEQYVDDAVHISPRKCRTESAKQLTWVFSFNSSLFDVIGEVTVSKRFGFMDAGSDNGFFAQIESMLRSGAWLGQTPALSWIHDYLSPVIGNHLAVTARHGRLREFAHRKLRVGKRLVAITKTC